MSGKNAQGLGAVLSFHLLLSFPLLLYPMNPFSIFPCSYYCFHCSYFLVLVSNHLGLGWWWPHFFHWPLILDLSNPNNILHATFQSLCPLQRPVMDVSCLCGQPEAVFLIVA